MILSENYGLSFTQNWKNLPISHEFLPIFKFQTTAEDVCSKRTLKFQIIAVK